MNMLNIYTTTNLKNSELEHTELESRKNKTLTIEDIRQANKELYRLYKRR